MNSYRITGTTYTVPRTVQSCRGVLTNSGTTSLTLPILGTHTQIGVFFEFQNASGVPLTITLVNSSVEPTLILIPNAIKRLVWSGVAYYSESVVSSGQYVTSNVSASSLSVTTAQYGTLFNLTGGSFTAVTLPVQTSGIADQGSFWTFQNTTGSTITPTITYGSGSGAGSSFTLVPNSMASILWTGTAYRLLPATHPVNQQLNLTNAGISNTGAIAGATTITASGLITGAGIAAGGAISGATTIATSGVITTGGGIRNISGSATAPSYTFSSDLSSGMFSPANNQLAFTTSGTERLRINASGWMGMNLQNPGVILDVSGAIQSTSNIRAIRAEIGLPFSGSTHTNVIEYLVVGGGGGGGTNHGGGGGAGGFLTGSVSAYWSSTHTVTVGTGGAATSGNNPSGSGTNSVFSTLTAIGGGRGSGYSYASTSGGSGGGGSSIGYGANTAGGAGTSGQGYAGGTGSMTFGSGGAGGGGAGSVGANGTATTSGNGGNGLSSAITGSVVMYAGGGGGGAEELSVVPGTGGTGGGGTGGYNGNGVNGTANRGGGGGGASYYYTSGSGGSGVVILAYPAIYGLLIVTGTTYTLSTVSRPGYNVYTFTAGTGSVTLAETSGKTYGTLGYDTSFNLQVFASNSLHLDTSGTTRAIVDASGINLCNHSLWNVCNVNGVAYPPPQTPSNWSSYPALTSVNNISGTATTPSYTFSSDTSSGLFSPASNQLSLTTAGTESMRINSSGWVGIGTTSPSVPLDVQGQLRNRIVTSNWTGLSNTIDVAQSNGNANYNYITDASFSRIFLTNPGVSYAGCWSLIKNNTTTALSIDLSYNVGATGPDTPMILYSSNSTTLVWTGTTYVRF